MTDASDIKRDWLHQSHGLGVGVQGPNVVLVLTIHLIFDEAMDFENEVSKAVTQAIVNATTE